MGCKFIDIPMYIMRILRHEADGAVPWAKRLSPLKDAEHTQEWNKQSWIEALGHSTDKHRMEYCEDENGTIIHIPAVQGHTVMVLHWIQPCLFERDNVALGTTHIPHGQLFQLQNQSEIVVYGRRI